MYFSALQVPCSVVSVYFPAGSELRINKGSPHTELPLFISSYSLSRQGQARDGVLYQCR